MDDPAAVEVFVFDGERLTAPDQRDLVAQPGLFTDLT
jgi:hypothetical protein